MASNFIKCCNDLQTKFVTVLTEVYCVLTLLWSVQPLPVHEELEWNDVGEEVRVGETEVQRQQFPADGEMCILRVVAGRINPIVLVCRSEQLELFEDKFELPGVGNEGHDVRR